jgi:CheY-like chemotaxis protein
MENRVLPDRFIIVDDDATNNLICKYTLRRIVTEYTLSSDLATILFLDINMPSMTGWEFLNLFQEFDETVRRQFRIYMLSSSVNELDRQQAEANPLVAGFISKPLTNEALGNIFNPG